MREVRLREADRDRAVHLVQQAYAEGRLSSGELERRLEHVLTAASPGELEPVLADLPDDLDGMDDVVELGSTGGAITRAGDWRVPRLLRIHSGYGGVRLDLSQAVVSYPVIDIELHLEYGSALIVVPPGASADADGAHTDWGGITSKVPGHAGTPHVRVSGRLAYGRVKIRHPRSWHRK
ncbi:DUF1707 SHOCT-like domain-containing protein [Nonomuraea aridisoli]|uniref:DUF1707 domain-containing protein n=1 Tax=Nonomuraea aridisoli TaxID=2070368 RepID=A0A2W2CXM5_9ACTN|nr:DUF1707 domain-containing protein [Nonomuraea aridisoli]PZG04492.1 hypothetical protein C1J01_44600 [Nonomuraea aridisoli]